VSFLAINSFEILVPIGSFSISDDDVVTFERGGTFSLEGCQYAHKRAISFQGNPDEDITSSAVRDWVKGRGSYWTFERLDGATTRFNQYSTEGALGFSVAVSASSNAKFGSYAMFLSASGSAAVTVPLATSGRFSVSVWRKENTASYQLCSVVYNGSTSIFYVGSTVTSGGFGWVTSTANGTSGGSAMFVVTLFGKDTTGAAATVAYDGLMAVPYALTVPMLAARNGRTAAEPDFPYVELSGDCLEDVSALVVKGFVEKQETMMVTLTSGFEYNARQTTYKLRER
jgi:hypothetical protein